MKTSLKWGRNSHESPRNPESLKQDKPKVKHPRHILIKLTKIKHKEQILKAAREKKKITRKGILIRIIADISIETLQARRELQDIIKVMIETKLQPRLWYPARISFKKQNKTKTKTTTTTTTTTTTYWK